MTTKRRPFCHPERQRRTYAKRWGFFFASIRLSISGGVETETGAARGLAFSRWHRLRQSATDAISSRYASLFATLIEHLDAED
jgi:hypothetical protein